MSISGNSLLTGIGSNTATAVGRLAPRFASALDGVFNGLRRSNPNDSVADASVGKYSTGSISRAELKALYQESTAVDPITRLITSNWKAAGATNVS